MSAWLLFPYRVEHGRISRGAGKKTRDDWLRPSMQMSTAPWQFHEYLMTGVESQWPGMPLDGDEQIEKAPRAVYRVGQNNVPR